MSRSPTDRGAALLETAIVAILLLSVSLGIVEFGSLFSRVHTMTSLSREGANLAARGSSLDESVAVTLSNGSDISLAALGGVIGSRIQVGDEEAVIVAQSISEGFEGESRLGEVGDQAEGVEEWGLADGQTVHVIEVFYHAPRITPFGSLVEIAMPDVLYERAVF